MITKTKQQEKQSRPPLWQRQTIAGKPIERHGIRITPQSEMISFGWAGSHATAEPIWSGLVWHRPTGLLVEQNEQTEYVPVVDVTRLAQLGLWALTAFFALIAWRYPTFSRRNLS